MLAAIGLILLWTVGLPIILTASWVAFCWIMTNIFGQEAWMQGGWVALFGIVPIGAIIGFIISIVIL